MLRARQGQKICYACRRRLRQYWTQASMSWLASTEASEAKSSLSYLVVPSNAAIRCTDARDHAGVEGCLLTQMIIGFRSRWSKWKIEFWWWCARTGEGLRSNQLQLTVQLDTGVELGTHT